MSVVFLKLAGAVASQPLYINLAEISHIDANQLYLRCGSVYELRAGTVEALVKLLPQVGLSDGGVAAIFLEVKMATESKEP